MELGAYYLQVVGYRTPLHIVQEHDGLNHQQYSFLPICMGCYHEQPYHLRVVPPTEAIVFELQCTNCGQRCRVRVIFGGEDRRFIIDSLVVYDPIIYLLSRRFDFAFVPDHYYLDAVEESSLTYFLCFQEGSSRDHPRFYRAIGVTFFRSYNIEEVDAVEDALETDDVDDYNLGNLFAEEEYNMFAEEEYKLNLANMFAEEESGEISEISVEEEIAGLMAEWVVDFGM